MADIKTKEVVKGTIKTIDKGVVATQKTKDNLVDIKNRSEKVTAKDENVNSYADNQMKAGTTGTIATFSKIKKKGNNSVRETKDNIVKAKQKVKNIKTKLAEKKKIKTVTTKTVKDTKKGVKTAQKVAKDTQKVAKETVKATKRAQQLARETAKKTYQVTKVTIKATISAIKGILAATKALISAIIAGGWIAIVIIIVICLIGLLCGSIFGIFFSGENTGGTTTMNQVVKELNTEMATKIQNIQDTNPHDDYKIETNRAEWKDVLIIYATKVGNGTMEQEVLTLNDEKVKTLKQVFWDMHTITSEVKTETVESNEYLNDPNAPTTQKVLYITISSKTVEQMMTQYYFTPIQKQQVEELSKDEYSSLWASPIYGTSLGSPNMVTIALSQVGNVGGEPYWSWYGFSSRVEWCACFVSWVADQSGYIQSNIIPKFSGVQNGIDWFKALGEWQDKNYTPLSGDIIFFDWENDGKPNHVGIVEKVENSKVYTIEGNSTNDTCRQKEYSLNSNVIFGYGTPAY